MTREIVHETVITETPIVNPNFPGQHYNNQYEQLLSKILREGNDKPDRTGTGTLSLFGQSLRFDLSKEGFPLITTKKVNVHSVIGELLWFLRGDTNIKFLHDNGIHIWDEWADSKGDLGPIYGKQWRRFGMTDFLDSLCPIESIDQINDVIAEIRLNPNSRRLIVTAWNPEEFYWDQPALPPCHVLFQFYVCNNKLSCQLYQRSADMFLGVPFNIAEYSLLTHIIAKITGYEVGDFIWVGGDCHIYKNHIDKVRKQLDRKVLYFPTLEIPTPDDVDRLVIRDFDFDSFVINNYNHWPFIKGNVSV